MKGICFGLLVVACIGFVGSGLIVQEPCCFSVEHVLAAFGPQNFSGYEGVGGPLRIAQEPTLCQDDKNDSELTGSVAFVPRGDCRFVDKVLLAQKKGAVAVVVYNNEVHDFGEDWVKMAVKGTEGDLVEIPSVFITFSSFYFLDDLMSMNPVVKVFINGTKAYEGDEFGASPLFLKSIMFMLQLLLVVWSMVAVFYLITWLKLRFAQRRRLEIVRKLPTRRYRAARGEGSDSGDGSCGHLTLPPSEDTVRNSGHHKLPVEESEIEMQPVHHLDAEDAAPLARSERSVSEDSSPITDYYNCESCVICICNFEDGEMITVLPCGHGYHKDCIEPWLISKSALCPICKQSILPSGDSRSLDEIAAADRNGSSADADAMQSRSVIVLVAGVIAIAVGSSLLYILKLYD